MRRIRFRCASFLKMMERKCLKTNDLMHKAVTGYGIALLTFHLPFVGPGGYACILTNKFLLLMGLTVVLFAAFPFLGSWKFPAKEWLSLIHI